MRTGLILAITGIACATAAAPAAATTISSDVTVGTWNLGTVAAALNVPEHRPWRLREPVIVSQIVRARLDVLGVQEASQSLGYQSLLLKESTQYRDLLTSLNDTGLVRYALTSDARGASLNNRILYKPRKLQMLQQGTFVYHRRAATGTGANRHLLRPRGMVWAVFEVKATGATFLFVDTHLQPSRPGVRLDQWHEQLQLIKQLQLGNPLRPVVAVGDYNQSMCSSGPRLDGPYKSAGIPNVVDGEDCHKHLPVRAKSYHNIWVGSYNAFDRSLSYKRNCRAAVRSDVSRTPCVGRNLDSIFASTRLKVPSYEVVADMNQSKTKLVGTIPSDHYLVKAVLSIPK
jgi:endonuclease/exonuclease/phosphatase family metal-dependent hydrolase